VSLAADSTTPVDSVMLAHKNFVGGGDGESIYLPDNN